MTRFCRQACATQAIVYVRRRPPQQLIEMESQGPVRLVEVELDAACQVK